MDSLIVCTALIVVIGIYFNSNPLQHGKKFMWRFKKSWKELRG